MSDSRDTGSGEIEERQFFRWTSEDAIATFREELEETRTVEVSLKEVYVETDQGGGTPQYIRVTFEVKLEDYYQMENDRWFGLKPGLARGMGFHFAQDRPVAVVAHVDSDTLDTLILPDFEPNDPGESMNELIAPLFDPDAFGIESPLGYEYERVTQPTEEGAVGFTAEGVKVQEQLEGEILPPAEMFLAQGQVVERTPEQEMEGVEYFKTEEALESLTAEVDSPAFFAGPQTLEGRLKQIKVLLGSEGAVRLSLVVDFDHEVFGVIEASTSFGLTEDSRTTMTFGPFDPELPVEMTLLLKSHLLQEYFSEPELDWEEALGVLAGTLADPEAEDPLRAAGAYVYETVMQQPRGQGFYVGFRNKNAPS